MAELKTEVKEKTILHNFETHPIMVCGNALVLSRPEKTSIILSERDCLAGSHKIKMAKLFTSKEETCPIHKCPLEKSNINSELDVYHFYTENLKKDKMHIFISMKDREKIKLEIYDRVAIEGYVLKIPSGKTMANDGIFCTKIAEYIEPIESQTSMLTKQDVIEQFGLDLPSLDMPKGMFNDYKHALLLSTVHTGITEICVGNPGTDKSSFGYLMIELAGGAFVDSNLATDVGLIGMACRGENGFFFAGGAIFAARDKLLVCDEIDNMIRKNPAFLKKLNGITGNHKISFRKGNVNFEDDFNVSLIAFANPIYGRFQTNPKSQIYQTFRENPEMLSRCHFIWALSCRVNPDNTREYDKKALRIYLQQARQMKVADKDITPEGKKAIMELHKKNISDERGHRKITDLCIAEAKLSLHKTVTVEDVQNIARLYETQNKLLNGR